MQDTRATFPIEYLQLKDSSGACLSAVGGRSRAKIEPFSNGKESVRLIYQNQLT